MAKSSDFIMTIDDEDNIETLEEHEPAVPEQKTTNKKKNKKTKYNLNLDDSAQETNEINSGFKINLEVDALDIVPQTIDFSLARASLAGKSMASKKRTVDDFIALKRREIKKAKSS
ncbi:hypothetical protein AYI69_g6451, partial [Smittium culicis]